MKVYGEWKYSSTILKVGIRWRWVVSPRYPLVIRLDGPQISCGRYEEKKSLAPTVNQTLSIQHVARLFAHWAIPTPNVC
jgi:hypothetical protein